jgi:hypothetical protein
MGEVTLKVPAVSVQALRNNVYGSLASKGEELDKRAGALGFPAGRSWHQLIADDDADTERDNIERHSVDVLEAVRKIAALNAVMDQLGWTDDIEGDLEVTADAELLRELVNGYLVDLGDELDTLTDEAPTKPAAIRVYMKRIDWCLVQQEALGKAVA